MRKVTQKFLRELVRDGYAVMYAGEKITKVDTIGYSCGLWFEGSDGVDYVVIGRKSELYAFA